MSHFGASHVRERLFVTSEVEPRRAPELGRHGSIEWRRHDEQSADLLEQQPVPLVIRFEIDGAEIALAVRALVAGK